MALWRKGCPRCRGDVLEQTDLDGRSLACLQCIYTLNPGQEAALRSRVRHAAERSTAAA
ncbi:MAG: hypothetical protein HY689_08080 [Chloroflexi bacterium]|nr:hypothetical protein [Chloroflexota bacterium]